MDLGVMVMKEYSTLSRATELEPHHQEQFKSHIQDIRKYRMARGFVLRFKGGCVYSWYVFLGFDFNPILFGGRVEKEGIQGTKRKRQTEGSFMV